MHAQAGQLVGGKYELLRLLGRGSMGEVWVARHATLEDDYAVKLIDVSDEPDAAARFQMEAFIAARLSKKTRHIVSVTDHGVEGHTAYLVMPRLEGETLESRIDRAAPLGLAEAVDLVTQISRALGHAQAEGFVHRDLKPANVFLTRDEDGKTVVKVLDFGIARVLRSARKRSPVATAKDTIVGTPSYMSPEQTRALDTLDHRTDVWALAVLAYEMLTREQPFEGESVQDVLISIGIGRMTPVHDRLPDLPPGLEAFFDRAFAARVDDRFAAAPELASAFARAVGMGDGATARLPVPGEAAPVVVHRARQGAPPAGAAHGSARTARRVLLVVLGLGALFLVVAGGVWLDRVPAHGPPPTTTAPDPSREAPSASPVPPVLSASQVARDASSPPPSETPGDDAALAPAVPPSRPVATRPGPSSPTSAAAPAATAAPTVKPPAGSAAPAPAPARSFDRGEVF